MFSPFFILTHCTSTRFLSRPSTFHGKNHLRTRVFIVSTEKYSSYANRLEPLDQSKSELRFMFRSLLAPFLSLLHLYHLLIICVNRHVSSAPSTSVHRVNVLLGLRCKPSLAQLIACSCLAKPTFLPALNLSYLLFV